VKPDVLPLQGGAADGVSIARAAHVLSGGGLVAFPTDTVYGLGAAVGSEAAMDKLYRVKGRDSNKPVARIVPDAATAKAAADAWPRLASKLARVYWPGALTIVAGGVGFRMPAHQAARALAAKAIGGLAATSANRSGEPDARTADEVLEMLGTDVDLVLDGGRTEGSPSTVVRVNGTTLEVLREGSIRCAELQEVSRATVLFVCRGNTCRSPTAAAAMETELASAGRHGVKVRSAGVDVGGEIGDASASAPAAAAAEVGLDLTGHRARPLTPSMLSEADWVFVMDRTQRDRIAEILPEEGPRVELLDPDGADIEDPAGEDREFYARTRDRIRAAVRARASSIVESLGAEGDETAA
jgi:tRNA threonylcarbamoyl adenosine modification protein (Sua5/YciO/YrdC/YwlC family)